MTKIVINPLTGLKEGVPDNTIVKTINGVHYLLNQSELSDLNTRNNEWDSNAEERQKEILRSIRELMFLEADNQIRKCLDKGLSTDEQQWRSYRDSLRDVTDQADIYNVVWPTKPTII